MQIICSECGHPFEDSECCWVCEARNDAIELMFKLAFPVAVFGISIGSLVALDLYPPFRSSFYGVYMIPATSLVIAVPLWLFLQDQISRYWRLVIFLIAFVACTFVLPPAYIFLNGLLDGKPAIEIPSTVVGKGISSGKGGGPFLVLNLMWNQEKINAGVRVTSRTLSDAEVGDSVRLVVHPGAFSLPWHGDVLFRKQYE